MIGIQKGTIVNHPHTVRGYTGSDVYCVVVQQVRRKIYEHAPRHFSCYDTL